MTCSSKHYVNLHPRTQAPPFDPAQSRTSQLLKCGDARCVCGSPACSCREGKCYYQRAYAERSSSEGWLVADNFAFPDGGAPTPVTFGCE